MSLAKKLEARRSRAGETFEAAQSELRAAMAAERLGNLRGRWETSARLAGLRELLDDPHAKIDRRLADALTRVGLLDANGEPTRAAEILVEEIDR